MRRGSCIAQWRAADERRGSCITQWRAAEERNGGEERYGERRNGVERRGSCIMQRRRGELQMRGEESASRSGEQRMREMGRGELQMRERRGSCITQWRGEERDVERRNGDEMKLHHAAEMEERRAADERRGICITQ